jgi:hypothetical protein
MMQKMPFFLGLDLNIDSTSRTVTAVLAAESVLALAMLVDPGHAAFHQVRAGIELILERLLDVEKILPGDVSGLHFAVPLDQGEYGVLLALPGIAALASSGAATNERFIRFLEKNAALSHDQLPAETAYGERRVSGAELNRSANDNTSRSTAP